MVLRWMVLREHHILCVQSTAFSDLGHGCERATFLQFQLRRICSHLSSLMILLSSFTGLHCSWLYNQAGI
ncbi:hypothetical protein Y1Q_0012171 [Alligator mississippiensis]|uniref:Uncharacterized protein n=1 Tax=Alligator mississippiensis TaxID=8496 RepID=A0A151N567_ALLMI|nr:hypothetical protein Y1Q_0012171 [Alligator mississippiensis]